MVVIRECGHHKILPDRDRTEEELCSANYCGLTLILHTNFIDDHANIPVYGYVTNHSSDFTLNNIFYNQLAFIFENSKINTINQMKLTLLIKKDEKETANTSPLTGEYAYFRKVAVLSEITPVASIYPKLFYDRWLYQFYQLQIFGKIYLHMSSEKLLV